MYISKEVRIGFLVTTAIVIFFTGFYFLKGADLFSNNFKYYAYYPDIDGLQPSANIQIKGLNVGHVTKMELAGERGVKVQITVSKKVKLPQGTVANLASPDLLGGKVIQLVPGPGPGTLSPESELASANGGNAVDKLTNELSPRLRELKGTIVVLDSALRGVNALMSADNQAAISAAIKSIKTTADNLALVSNALGHESGAIAGIVRDAGAFTSTLAKSKDTIQRILANASTATRQMANAPIQRTIADLQKATDQLQSVVNKVNSSQGSLGMLINNKDLYNNLNGSVTSLRDLTNDMKAHPKRYLNFSVFGGGKKSK
ncbi:MAG: MlaD family protein [Bacteroidota bacterium]